MDSSFSVSVLAGRELTEEVRREFAIPSVTFGDSVTFRIGPGPVFERTVRLARSPHGPVRLDLLQRYRPDEYMTRVAGTPVGGCLAEDLRSAIWFADWKEHRPHWREACRTQHPPWARAVSVTGPDVIEKSLSAVTGAARDKGIAHYLWRDRPGRIGYGNNPPPLEVVFSVNPAGEWSFHDGRDTRPLRTAPDLAGALAEEHGAAARLAALDLGTTAAAAIRSGNQAAAPADRPAPGRPVRRR